MLSRYEGKTVRVTTEDGSVFTGEAEAFPTGYGLHEFGVAEESLSVDDAQIFLSDIAKIELLPPRVPDAGEAARERLIETLLEGPYWIADLLPSQVPRDAPGQYFAVERYFRHPARMVAIRRKQAELLLRMNCFLDMEVSFDGGEHWEMNPDPERFVGRLTLLKGTQFLRAVFPAEETMIEIEPDDTWMTVCCLAQEPPALLRQLAAAEGLFLWQPEGAEA